MSITNRSPRRSVTQPQATRVSITPTVGAAATTPASARLMPCGAAQGSGTPDRGSSRPRPPARACSRRASPTAGGADVVRRGEVWVAGPSQSPCVRSWRRISSEWCVRNRQRRMRALATPRSMTAPVPSSRVIRRATTEIRTVFSTIFGSIFARPGISIGAGVRELLGLAVRGDGADPVPLVFEVTLPAAVRVTLPGRPPRRSRARRRRGSARRSSRAPSRRSCP